MNLISAQTFILPVSVFFVMKEREKKGAGEGFPLKHSWMVVPVKDSISGRFWAILVKFHDLHMERERERERERENNVERVDEIHKMQTQEYSDLSERNKK